MKKFNPKCMTTDTQMAINNRNQLMPCCFIDTPFLVEDPTIKKLLSVSNISEHKSIKEILNKKEWVEFYDMLKEADDKQITERLNHVSRCFVFGKENKEEEWQTYLTLAEHTGIVLFNCRLRGQRTNQLFGSKSILIIQILKIK